MNIAHINRAIEPIIKKYQPKLSERVVLKKTADLYDFLHNYLDASISIKGLANGIEEEKDITMFVLKNNYGLYHTPKHKTLREKLAKLFTDNGFTKLAKDILKFDNDGKPHLRANDLNHIQKITTQLKEVIKNPKLKEKITRLLARYM